MRLTDKIRIHAMIVLNLERSIRIYFSHDDLRPMMARDIEQDLRILTELSEKGLV